MREDIRLDPTKQARGAVPANLVFARRTRAMNRAGFTLIELLIVVVIIGILASIAIPKFGSTKERAYLAKMKSDLRNLATAQESYLSDNQVYYGGAVPNATLRRTPRPAAPPSRSPRPRRRLVRQHHLHRDDQDLRVLLRIGRTARAGDRRGADRLRPVTGDTR